jgi:hypothetical protein
MPSTLRHPRRARRERRVVADPAEERYRRAVEVVRRHKLQRLTDNRQALWNHVDDMVPKSEATLLHERALKTMECLIGGRWEPADEIVPSRSLDSRVVAAPNPRDAVMDSATALYEEATALSARLAAAEVSAATAARLSRAQGPTTIATAEFRQVGTELTRVVADLERLAAPGHETPTPVREHAPAATAGSHAA